MSAGAPVLAGVLTDFALADALQLLELGMRTGVLVVDGGPFGAGRVLVHRGRVTGVVHGDGTPALDAPAAVADLLDIPRGRWTFHAKDTSALDADRASADSGASSIGTILVEAARRRDERARAGADRDFVDSDVLATRLTDDTASGTGRLTAAHLRVLGAVDGRRDVREIAAALRWDVARVRLAAGVLRDCGLLEVVGPPASLGAAA